MLTGISKNNNTYYYEENLEILIGEFSGRPVFFDNTDIKIIYDTGTYSVKKTELKKRKRDEFSNFLGGSDTLSYYKIGLKDLSLNLRYIETISKFEVSLLELSNPGAIKNDIQNYMQECERLGLNDLSICLQNESSKKILINFLAQWAFISSRDDVFKELVNWMLECKNLTIIEILYAAFVQSRKIYIEYQIKIHGGSLDKCKQFDTISTGGLFLKLMQQLAPKFFFDKIFKFIDCVPETVLEPVLYQKVISISLEDTKKGLFEAFINYFIGDIRNEMKENIGCIVRFITLVYEKYSAMPAYSNIKYELFELCVNKLIKDTKFDFLEKFIEEAVNKLPTTRTREQFSAGLYNTAYKKIQNTDHSNLKNSIYKKLQKCIETVQKLKFQQQENKN